MILINSAWCKGKTFFSHSHYYLFSPLLYYHHPQHQQQRTTTDCSASSILHQTRHFIQFSFPLWSRFYKHENMYICMSKEKVKFVRLFFFSACLWHCDGITHTTVKTSGYNNASSFFTFSFIQFLQMIYLLPRTYSRVKYLSGIRTKKGIHTKISFF